MASYDAVIKLVVQGEDALKRIQDRVDKLYKTIDDLEKKKKYAGSEAAVSFVRQQADELERVLAVSKQIIKQDEQRIIKQSKLNSAVDLYERRLKQTVNSGAAGLKKFEGQIKEIETAFKFFKDRGNVTAIQALATELGRMVEYSNNVSRNERARAANQAKVFEYVKQINAYEAQGLNVAEARKKLSEFTAVASTNQLNEAKKYADAVERQLRLLRAQVALQKQVAAETKVLQNALAQLENTQRELENSKLDQKALQIQAALDRQAAAAAESAAQLAKLNERQAEFLSRTDAAAAAAKRQTAEFIRQQRIAKEVAALNAAAPAPQLLLPAAAPGAPAMSGGARPRISGPVEIAGRLPGARFAGRTEDEAAMALRLAQNLRKAVPEAAALDKIFNEVEQSLSNIVKLTKPQTKAGKGGGGAQGGMGRLAENLMLGAGFPLLFGGGAGQVLGGVAGSFVGPGFGGQIFFSALFGQLEKLGVSATEAGKALQKPIDNFSVIEQRAILASSSQEKYIKQLIDSGQYIEATAAIQQRYNEIVGKDGSESLLELAASSDRLTRAWAELSLQIQAALAGPLAGFLEWLARVVEGVSGPQETQTLKDFMQQLTPQQQKEYLRRSTELAKQFSGTAGAFDGTSPEQLAAIKKLQQEFVPGFGKGVQQDTVTSILANETKLTAELDRRKQLQEQITKYRQSELSFAQQQLQQDITLLSKQQEFATSLNQQAALIDQIATKKQQNADLELAKIIETQKAEIDSKQIAYERLKLDAQVAEEKLKQDKVSQKLLESDKQSLQATIDKLPLAEKELELIKQIASNAINRAASDNQSAKYLADIEARQQKVAAYAADAARQTEAFNRAANEAVNAINNNLTVIQAYAQAQQTINNLQIQSLQSNLQLATSTSERLAILNKIRDLEILNAKIALNATRAQIKAEVERQRIALAMTEQKYKQLQADVAMAKAQGVLNQDHLEALANQKSALTIAIDNYNTSLKVANEQWRAADAVYEAAVRAADFKVSMEAAATAAQQTAAAATTTAEQTAAAASYTMGATNTVITKRAGFVTPRELRELQGRLGGMFGLNASYYGQDEETLAAMRSNRQQQQEATAQQMADNLQRLRAAPTERSTGTTGPINIQTGPVLQQDGKKYVTLEDMESAIQSMASTIYSSNRAAGTQRFTGVR